MYCGMMNIIALWVCNNLYNIPGMCIYPIQLKYHEFVYIIMIYMHACTHTHSLSLSHTDEGGDPFFLRHCLLLQLL